jgi:hypothetical protein
MGWSSTGQEISFLITHPGRDPQWAAAVVVDGWTGHNYATAMVESAKDAASKLESGGGGGMDGDPDRVEARTLDEARTRFLKRSPAWNAARARTPLMLRYHNYRNMMAAEIYTALWSRGKPVEYWWMVHAAHELQLPSERTAGLNQVVDWFRFWLQGYERASVPDDPDRYVRWRALRAQHEQNEKAIKEGKDPEVVFRAREKEGSR